MLAVRALGKIAFRSLVSNVYNLIGLKPVMRASSKDYYCNTMYNKAFKLPPVFNLVGSNCSHLSILLSISYYF